MAEPDVTVVIPTRDRAHVVSHAVDSAVSQRDVGVEVIVVDDGSRDSTGAVLAGRDRVRVIRLPTSKGQANARNVGIEAARGAWIAFLDDDDLWEPTKLRRQLTAAEQTGAGWVFAESIAVRADGIVLWTERVSDPSTIYEQLLRTHPIPAAASNVVARRDVLQRVGGFDTSLEHFSDWDLWIRLAAAAPAAVVDEVLVAYVRHQGNLHIADVRGAHRELHAFVAKVRADTGQAPDLGLLEEWLAYGHRQAGDHRAAAVLGLSAARRLRSRRVLKRALYDLAVHLGVKQPYEGTAGPAPAWAVPGWTSTTQAVAP